MAEVGDTRSSQSGHMHIDHTGVTVVRHVFSVTFVVCAGCHTLHGLMAETEFNFVSVWLTACICVSPGRLENVLLAVAPCNG